MNDLTIPELMEEILKNKRAILDLGLDRTLARNKLILCEAALMDKEAELYPQLEEKIPATRLSLAIKHGALKERKAEKEARRKFQEKQDAFEILIEVNNSLKTYIRLREEEMRNLLNS